MKDFKRVIAALVAVIMIAGVSFAAFADETDATVPSTDTTVTEESQESAEEQQTGTEADTASDGQAEGTETNETGLTPETTVADQEEAVSGEEAATTPEVTPEVTPETTPEATPEVTPEVTPEATPEVTPEPTIPPQYTNAGVYGYVTRLYGTVLGRTADETGLNEWYGGLTEGRLEAAETALGFFESPEYLAKERSNEEYVADLYRTFFDREGDPEGAAGWLARLSEGVSRRNVLKGFVDSDEFTRLCERFQVVKGTVAPEGASESDYLVYRFVERLYSEALGRSADTAGLNSWAQQLTSNGATGANVAYGFVFSPECQNRTGDAAAYVQVLYRTLLGREADAAGLEGWIASLTGGETREKVFEGFVNSTEFTLICQQYGITRGDYHAGRYIDPNRPMVALTFDDGPSTRTHEILDCIEANGGAVTFFVQGCMAQYHPDDLRRMIDLGCEIGNHSYDHPYLTRLSPEGLASQLGRTNDIVFNATGTYPTVLRPPYGAHNATTDASCGLPVIIWSVDTRDWATRNTQSTIDHVLSHANDGEIILMHDIHTSTVDAALYLIPELQRRGIQLVTVSELAEYRGNGAQAGTVYYSFR